MMQEVLEQYFDKDLQWLEQARNKSMSTLLDDLEDALGPERLRG